MENVYRLETSRELARARSFKASDDKDKAPDNIEETAERFLRSPTNPMYQQWLIRFFERHYEPYFTAGQWMMLRHILAQTVSFGWVTWGFRKSAIANGRQTANGEVATKGTGYHPRHIRRLVKELETAGVIFVERSYKGLQITPNVSWKPYDGMPLAAERRKRLKRQSEAKTTMLHVASPAGGAVVPPAVDRRRDINVPSYRDGDVPPSGTTMSPIREEDVREEDVGGEALTETLSGLGTDLREKEKTSATPKETKPTRPRPPQPPRKTTDDDTRISLGVDTLDRTLRRAFAMGYPDVSASRWPETQRLGLAHFITHSWPSIASKNWTPNRTASECHRFAHWVVNTWETFAVLYEGADEFPNKQFVSRYIGWFVRTYQANRKVYGTSDDRRDIEYPTLQKKWR